ncbi:MAG: hypothetical protein ACXVB9_14440 [Bdellovibrionota bacterium]
MKNPTLCLLLSVIGFVGATSCGDQNNQNASLQAQNAALMAALAQRNAAGATNATVTQIATAVQNVTVTSGTSNVGTSVQSTVVYTVTSNNVNLGTASATTRQ